MHRTIVGLLAALSAAVALPFVAAAQKPKDNKVTLAAAPNPIRFSNATTLSGKVTGPDHAGVAVTLRADPFPVDADTVVATATTDANGDFQFTGIMPDRNTRYSASAKTSPPVESAAVDVLVRVRVTLRLGDATPRVGQRVRFFGSAAPQHDGSVVRIQRRRATGSWKTVGLTLLRDAGDERSRYSRRLRIRRDGTYRARVIAVDGDHLSGTSRRRSVEVH
jgi:opacity protein-like surface antigen